MDHKNATVLLQGMRVFVNLEVMRPFLSLELREEVGVGTVDTLEKSDNIDPLM